MTDYTPCFPFNVPAYLLIPTYENVKGVMKKTYPDPADGVTIFCSFKTFGGTEAVKDGLLAVIDTANIETWYRPDIKSDCHIVLADQQSKIYEVIGEPENINMRNQFIKFKVQAISGGA